MRMTYIWNSIGSTEMWYVLVQTASVSLDLESRKIFTGSRKALSRYFAPPRSLSKADINSLTSIYLFKTL
jgi:hypothetical protein